MPPDLLSIKRRTTIGPEHPIPPNHKNSSPSYARFKHDSLSSHSQSQPRMHRLSSSVSSPQLSGSERSAPDSFPWSDSSSDSETPITPVTDPQSEDGTVLKELENTAQIGVTRSDSRRAKTTLLTQDPSILREEVGDGESGTELLQKFCCGGVCCFLNPPPPEPLPDSAIPLELPDNDAFRSLGLKLGPIHEDIQLTGIPPLPLSDVQIKTMPRTEASPALHSSRQHPPEFVQPHPPYHVFSAPLHHARELTKAGAEKRTFHFDIDVTDYPEEADVDFKVGGAIGVTPPNNPDAVEELFDVLGVPKSIRDKPVTLETAGGRWPTIWGEEESRTLVTTRRQILTWCTDIQSYPPTKQLLRLMAEYATKPHEKMILLFLTSDQGQPSFCDLRTGEHLTISQLFHAFPSSKPPLNELLSVVSQLMPRFYSLSNDPYVSSKRSGIGGRRLIEIAVTVHRSSGWDQSDRTGVGSGFLERIAKQFIDAENQALQRGLSSHEAHAEAQKLDLRIPMFKGLMANPLSKEFGGSDGPMMLVGAGVGMAPFRGFILNRLRNANCASKIWLVQGVRDSSLDELYSGELGEYESQIKKVVQSRARRRLSQVQRTQSETNLGALSKNRTKDESSRKWKVNPDTESKYVQDELKQQADVVWDVIRSVDGRVFVCGSSQGMGEGVEQALREVAMMKGGYSAEGAANFWEEQKVAGKYIAETW